MIGGMAWGNDKTSPPLTDHEQQKKATNHRKESNLRMTRRC